VAVREEEENRPLPGQTVKQRAIEALRTLPEETTIDDAIERLCLIAKIEEGLRQSDAGRLTDHEEVKKRFLA
jgi:predicted transcriptional regulator